MVGDNGEEYDKFVYELQCESSKLIKVNGNIYGAAGIGQKSR